MSGRQHFPDLEQHLVVLPLDRCSWRPLARLHTNMKWHFIEKMLTQAEKKQLSPGPNLNFWMLHRPRPSFPVFSWKWSPWQHTSLSQVVPVRAREAGGHLDGHGVSRLVSHKLKTSSPSTPSGMCFTPRPDPERTHRDEHRIRIQYISDILSTI